jgi:hypothetical protein
MICVRWVDVLGDIEWSLYRGRQHFDQCLHFDEFDELFVIRSDSPLIRGFYKLHKGMKLRRVIKI